MNHKTLNPPTHEDIREQTISTLVDAAAKNDKLASAGDEHALSTHPMHVTNDNKS